PLCRLEILAYHILFPYTTLFRSLSPVTPSEPGGIRPAGLARIGRTPRTPPPAVPPKFPRPGGGVETGRPPGRKGGEGRAPSPPRSEEHTSELQSRENLVCRLLLE